MEKQEGQRRNKRLDGTYSLCEAFAFPLCPALVPLCQRVQKAEPGAAFFCQPVAYCVALDMECVKWTSCASAGQLLHWCGFCALLLFAISWCTCAVVLVSSLRRRTDCAGCRLASFCGSGACFESKSVSLVHSPRFPACVLLPQVRF